MPFFFIIIGIVVLVGFLVYGTFFSSNAIVKRKLRKAPITPIHNFKQGQFGRILGKAEPINNVLRSPLSGRKCVYYKIEVQKKVSNGKSSSWRTIITEDLATDFYIRQGFSSIAHIRTDRVKGFLDQDAHFKSGFMNDAKPFMESFLRKHGHESTGFFGMNKTMRFREGIVEVGEEVAVAGLGFWMMPEYPIQDLQGEHILFIQPSEKEPVYISDNARAKK